MLASEHELAPEAFPVGLHDLADPPKELFLHGVVPSGPVVALVGTRRPTIESAQFTQRLAAELSDAGVVVASGGAMGIDTAAHQAVMDAGGSTLVVAPCGFRRPYPESNRTLFSDVVAGGGGYLSEFRDDHVARRHQFFRRNAILVAIAHVVVIVESPLRGGARNAALWARRLGRRLFAVPQAPWNARGLGNLEELRLGAQLLVRARDVLDVLTQLNQHPMADLVRPHAPPVQQSLGFEVRAARPPPEGPSSLAEAIVHALGGDAIHVDELCRRIAHPDTPSLLACIGELSLSGEIELDVAGCVRRSKKH